MTPGRLTPGLTPGRSRHHVLSSGIFCFPNRYGSFIFHLQWDRVNLTHGVRSIIQPISRCSFSIQPAVRFTEPTRQNLSSPTRQNQSSPDSSWFRLEWGQLLFRWRFIAISIGGEDYCCFDDDSSQPQSAARTIGVSKTIQRNFDRRRRQLRFWRRFSVLSNGG